MLTRLRRRRLLAPAVILWIASIPITFALAPHEGARGRVSVVEAGALRPLPAPAATPRVPARVARAAKPLVYVARDGEHITPARLRRYLWRRHSPMAAHAETLVAAGIAYRMDPRAVVAVAGAESSFGLVMPCHNAWGWERGACRWSSWRQAIMTYTRLVSAHYPSLRRGDFRTAGRTYNPGNWAQWAARCRGYFSAI